MGPAIERINALTIYINIVAIIKISWQNDQAWVPRLT